MKPTDFDAHEALQAAARRGLCSDLDQHGEPLRGRGPLAPGARPPLLHVIATLSVLVVTAATGLLFVGAWLDSALLVITGGALFIAALLAIAVLAFACDDR